MLALDAGGGFATTFVLMLAVDTGGGFATRVALMLAVDAGGLATRVVLTLDACGFATTVVLMPTLDACGFATRVVLTLASAAGGGFATRMDFAMVAGDVLPTRMDFAVVAFTGHALRGDLATGHAFATGGDLATGFATGDDLATGGTWSALATGDAGRADPAFWIGDALGSAGFRTSSATSHRRSNLRPSPLARLFPEPPSASSRAWRLLLLCLYRVSSYTTSMMLPFFLDSKPSLRQ